MMKVEDIPPHRVALIVHGFIPDLKKTGWLVGDLPVPEGMKLGIVFVSPQNEILGLQWAPYADHARYAARDYRKHTPARILDVSPSKRKRADMEARRGDRWDLRPAQWDAIPYDALREAETFLEVRDLPLMPKKTED